MLHAEENNKNDQQLKPEILSDFVAKWALKTPDAEALIGPDERISYAVLNQRVRRCASKLLALGLGPRDRVAMIGTPNDRYVVVYLATMSIGAVWVGLNPRYQQSELVRNVADCQPSVLFAYKSIADRSYCEAIEAIEEVVEGALDIVLLDSAEDANGGKISWRSVLQTPIDEGALHTARQSIEPTDAAVIVYTSGSTGAPKGAVLSHSAVSKYAQIQNDVWPVDPIRTLNYFPINHVGCLVDVTAPCLVGGGAMVLMEQFEPAGALNILAKEKITVWGGVPAVFQLQLAFCKISDYDLSNVQLIVWEGGAMPLETIRALKEVCPRLATNYSMTESTGAITIVEPTDDEDILSSSVGTPLAGVEVRLQRSDDEASSDNRVGEIEIKSPYQMTEYWGREDETKRAFTEDGWLKTGDLGVWREDGRLKLVGRSKEMYKSGGYNVYPREIEAVLESHPDVYAVAVVSAPDPIWDEVGVAFVVAGGGLTQDDLQGYCRDKLANYKIPKKISLVSELPLLPIGKVDKKTLKENAKNIYGS